MQHSGGVLLAGQGPGHTMINSIPLGSSIKERRIGYNYLCQFCVFYCFLVVFLSLEIIKIKFCNEKSLSIIKTLPKYQKYGIIKIRGDDMRYFKIIGMLFTIVGIVFCVLGSIKCIFELPQKEARIYTIGKIIKIEEYDTGDPEFLTNNRTFVEFEVNGESVVSELNTSSSSFYTGQKLEIYYFDNQTEIVYKKGSDALLILFPVVGITIATIGCLLAFNKKVQTLLSKIPAAECN
jgi:hypothetical protein